ncbi:hypothetical protein A5681_15210 [Mycobacterium scrofulaceum]|uniref:DUF3060 domain-containing protein n=1 Tax=Mycobacterium scrofulaceum TaxID=1783 RepID=UPI0007FD9132|nr:DUF3060 domain-containing protein [Mycobacterium scrofulaceum]OBH86570.1 hypothetical protein A5681_15210 [Mycobacterium scrofulaceum]
MAANDDPEDRIRELERPLADAARASEASSAQPAGQAFQPPPGSEVTVTGMGENRTIACNDNVVDVSGVSNTVVISGHCASLSVTGVQNGITVDAVDSIDVSGLSNKITYHSGTPKITNSGSANVVQQG